MACFASFLLIGHTLLCKSIKVGTVKKYLLAVKDFFIDHNQWDPCIVKHGTTAPVLTSVYKEGQRWESMPNRQEPITMEIMRFLISQASTSHQDSPEAAIADWCITGSQSGFRCSEWAQPHSSKSLPLSATITKNVDGSATAFLAEDFILLNKHKRPLVFSLSLDHTKVFYCSTKWRYQKNGDNGQIITYARNDEDPEMCYISAILRILTRATRLAVKPSSPIAVAMVKRKKRKFPSFITSTLVTMYFQAAARQVHRITLQKDLDRFSSHSIRVWACVLLHTHGKSPDYIKLRLRWRSDSYKDYLRDVSMLAVEHADVIHQAVTTLNAS